MTNETRRNSDDGATTGTGDENENNNCNTKCPALRLYCFFTVRNYGDARDEWNELLAGFSDQAARRKQYKRDLDAYRRGAIVAVVSWAGVLISLTSLAGMMAG